MADRKNHLAPERKGNALKYRSASEDEIQFGYNPIDEMRRTVNTQTYTPEQAAQNRQNTIMELLYASPLGNALSARDAMEAKWRGQELEASGDAEGARQAYAEAATNAGMAFLPGMGRVGVGRNAATAAHAGQDYLYAIPAWHGSPHNFDRFDMSKIGTGEGMQAYGHGLYFAENPAVANAYRNALSQNPFPSGDPRYGAWLINRSRDEAGARAWLMERVPVNQIDDIMADVKAAQSGTIYRTELDVEPEDLLDWDKPLAQQSEKVKAAIGRMPEGKTLFDQEARVRQIEGRLAELKAQRMTPEVSAEVTALSRQLLQERQKLRGLESYFEDYKSLTGNSAATQVLREAGIPGISYLDEGSRGIGQGTRNYVIFDDKLVKILDKEGAQSAMTPPNQSAPVSPPTARRSWTRSEAEGYFRQYGKYPPGYDPFNLTNSRS